MRYAVSSVMKDGSNLKSDNKDYKHGTNKPRKGSGRQVKVFKTEAEAKKFSGGAPVKKITDKVASDPAALMKLFPEENESIVSHLETGNINGFKDMVHNKIDELVKDRIQLKRIEMGSNILAPIIGSEEE